MISFSAADWFGQALRIGDRAAYHRRHVLLGVQPGRLDHGLSRVPVSIAYPMLSIGYVVNAVAAYYLFGESLGLSRWLGIGFIIVGVYLVSRP